MAPASAEFLTTLLLLAVIVAMAIATLITVIVWPLDRPLSPEPGFGELPHITRAELERLTFRTGCPPAAGCGRRPARIPSTVAAVRNFISRKIMGGGDAAAR